jgi:putative flippase GtrA
VRPHSIAPIRYLVVGAGNTVAGLLVIYACKWLLGLGDITANIIGYAFGFSLSFVLNKHWTFGFRGAAAPALLRFLGVTLVAYLANIVTVLLLIYAGLDSYAAQTAGILPYTILGYLGSRYFAFGRLFQPSPGPRH